MKILLALLLASIPAGAALRPPDEVAVVVARAEAGHPLEAADRLRALVAKAPRHPAAIPTLVRIAAAQRRLIPLAARADVAALEALWRDGGMTIVAYNRAAKEATFAQALPALEDALEAQLFVLPKQPLRPAVEPRNPYLPASHVTTMIVAKKARTEADREAVLQALERQEARWEGQHPTIVELLRDQNGGLRRTLARARRTSR